MSRFAHRLAINGDARWDKGDRARSNHDVLCCHLSAHVHAACAQDPCTTLAHQFGSQLTSIASHNIVYGQDPDEVVLEAAQITLPIEGL